MSLIGHMSEIIYIAATGAIGALSGILGTYVMGKHVLSDDNIIEKLDMIVTKTLEDPKMQQKIYMIGGIIGKGLRDGTGLDSLIPKNKQKGGLEGLIMQLAGQYLGGKLGNLIPTGVPQNEQQPRPQNW